MKKYQSHTVKRNGTIEVVCIDSDGGKHRYLLVPGSDLAEQPDEVAEAARATWTQEVIEQYRARIESNALPEPSHDDRVDIVKRRRRAAYQDESDPLFFTYQRGETTKAEWLDKVAEIKARFPSPAQED